MRSQGGWRRRLPFSAAPGPARLSPPGPRRWGSDGLLSAPTRGCRTLGSYAATPTAPPASASAVALSRAQPGPWTGRIPSLWQAEAKAPEVCWIPLSVWKITPDASLPEAATAIWIAAWASPAVGWRSDSAKPSRCPREQVLHGCEEQRALRRCGSA